jgi:peroxin-19
MEKKPGDLEGLAESSGKAIKTESQDAKANIPTPVAATTSVPDPDEDDLDDLDGE